MILLLFALLFAATLSAAAPSASSSQAANENCKWVIGQRVETTSGKVQGHAASNATEVSEYLGIPYAVPPVGRLRFQPPIRYKGKNTINGTDFVGTKHLVKCCTVANTNCNTRAMAAYSQIYLHLIMTFPMILSKHTA